MRLLLITDVVQIVGELGGGFAIGVDRRNSSGRGVYYVGLGDGYAT